MSLTARIKAEARGLGFDLVGVLPAGPSLTHSFYKDWLARGYAGEMAYLERHAEAKSDLRKLAPGARSAIFLAINYHSPAASHGSAAGHSSAAGHGPAANHGSAANHSPAPNPRRSPYRGRISRYAWSRDYHEVLKEKLKALARYVENEALGPVRSWCFVDSAPVMEREFAARAGLGWVGKHGVLIHWEQGSWLFVAELLLDLELEYDLPEAAHGAREPKLDLDALRESCGSCTACIDACPTDAIVAEKTVDSRRCISYHTIELRGPIPEVFRPQIGEWVFGCDICQEVCPWNRRAPVSANSSFAQSGDRATPDLLRLLGLDEKGFREEFAGTALMRTKRRGLLRNAAIVLGNRLAQLRGMDGALPAGHDAAVAVLARCLEDAEPLIRGAAAWALGRAGAQVAREPLARAAGREGDDTVREEIARAAIKLSGRPAQP